MAGFYGAAGDRLRALGVIGWKNRTKVAGYAGVGFGAAQVLQGQPWHTLILGVTVALIGHFNDHAAAP